VRSQVNEVSREDRTSHLFLDEHRLPVITSVPTRLYDLILNIQMFACMRFEAHEIIWEDVTTCSLILLLNCQCLPCTLIVPPCLHSLTCDVDVLPTMCLQIHGIAGFDSPSMSIRLLDYNGLPVTLRFPTRPHFTIRDINVVPMSCPRLQEYGVT